MYNENNHALITKQNLLAKNATDTKTIVFPANEIYHMVVAITGLLKILSQVIRLILQGMA
jgi:hypothetical protein